MASIEVRANGPVAQMVITRADGHELSLSSDRGSLIEWNGGECIVDHGSYNRDAELVLSIVREFLSDSEG